MGRESSNPIVIQFSIALLQERFRQLRRMKKMREERELLMRKLQKSNQYEAMVVTEDYDPMVAGFFFHQGHHLHLFPSGLILIHKASNRPWTTPNSEVSSIKPEGYSDSDDVDTSLHL
ncbi:hypothetical protein SLE2022_322590 [Rubroshorea leprosula]